MSKLGIEMQVLGRNVDLHWLSRRLLPRSKVHNRFCQSCDRGIDTVKWCRLATRSASDHLKTLQVQVYSFLQGKKWRKNGVRFRVVTVGCDGSVKVLLRHRLRLLRRQADMRNQCDATNSYTWGIVALEHCQERDEASDLRSYWTPRLIWLAL